MKTITCKELGGACDMKFRGTTFDEIVEQSKRHGMQMFQEQDATHLQAMADMQKLMQDPQAMQAWFNSKKEAFNNLPDDE